MWGKKSMALAILLMTGVQTAFSDTGYGESAAGFLTSLPPSAPTLKSPEDNAVQIMSSTVEWNQLDHATTYELQVSTDSDFINLISDETELISTTFDVPGLGGDLIYYWHVKAVNVAGAGNYSDVWKFHTDASLPVQLICLSAEFTGNGVLLKWQTMCETNHLGFILERREKNEARLAHWQVINSYLIDDAMKGQGNTSSKTEYAFLDINVEQGSIYTYRLSDVNIKGDVNVCDMIQIALPDAPRFILLDRPFPNPFNPRTKIGYRLENRGWVEIIVYDVMGRKVCTLMHEQQPGGTHHVYWYGKDNSGASVSSGTYLIIMRSAEYVGIQKLVLLR